MRRPRRRTSSYGVQLADDAFEVDGCADLVEYTRSGRSSDGPLIPM